MQRLELGQDQPPLIFWLLAGYFRSQPEKFKEEGGIGQVVYGNVKDQDPYATAKKGEEDNSDN